MRRAIITLPNVMNKRSFSSENHKKKKIEFKLHGTDNIKHTYAMSQLKKIEMNLFPDGCIPKITPIKMFQNKN